jgi:molybdate transport system ATP-binding protein
VVVAALSVDIRTVVDSFSLEVKFQVDGRTTAILGESGAGKTLTLRSIAGLTRPRHGHIVLGERTLFDAATGLHLPPRHRHVGLMFQEYALFPNLSVRGNLSYGLAGRPRAEVAQRVAELVSSLQLEGLEHRAPSQLSGGQQQRVALGRALAPSPELLLLDEPFSALDTPTKVVLIEQFQMLSKELAFTTLLVTHDISEAYALASHLVVLDHGKVIQDGSREEVFHHPVSPTAASLLGMRNLVPGRVVKGNMDGIVLEMAGVRIHAPGSALKAGTSVTIGIRPEQMTAISGSSPIASDTGSVFAGTLTQAGDRGTHRRLLLSIGTGSKGPGLPLHVETDQPITDTALGREWTVTVPRTAVHYWPADVPSP